MELHSSSKSSPLINSFKLDWPFSSCKPPKIWWCQWEDMISELFGSFLVNVLEILLYRFVRRKKAFVCYAIQVHSIHIDIATDLKMFIFGITFQTVLRNEDMTKFSFPNRVVAHPNLVSVFSQDLQCSRTFKLTSLGPLYKKSKIHFHVC